MGESGYFVAINLPFEKKLLGSALLSRQKCYANLHHVCALYHLLMILL